MSSYLANFNYQLIQGQTTSDTPPRKWVFLHGLMGFGLNWRTIASKLSTSDQSLLLDQRGHGRSFQPTSGYAPQDYAEDLELIRQELGWDKFYLVGHSMGGRNALFYAHLFPQYLTKLIVVDIGPELQQSAVDYFSQLLGAVPTPFANKQLAKDFFLNEFRSLPVAREQPSSLGSYLYANLIETPRGYDWRFSKAAILESVKSGRSENHWSKIEQLQVPTLWIRGEQSKDLSRATFEKILQLNPLIEGIEISNAGHWVHTDQPELFLAAIQSFVSKA